jgi:hypothetical protein
LLTIAAVFSAERVTQPSRLLTGKAAMGDWTSDAPGVRDGALLFSDDGNGTNWRVSYRE